MHAFVFRIWYIRIFQMNETAATSDLIPTYTASFLHGSAWSVASIIQIVILVVIIFFGTFGNILVVVTICRVCI